MTAAPRHQLRRAAAAYRRALMVRAEASWQAERHPSPATRAQLAEATRDAIRARDRFHSTYLGLPLKGPGLTLPDALRLLHRHDAEVITTSRDRVLVQLPLGSLPRDLVAALRVLLSASPTELRRALFPEPVKPPGTSDET